MRGIISSKILRVNNPFPTYIPYPNKPYFLFTANYKSSKRNPGNNRYYNTPLTTNNKSIKPDPNSDDYYNIIYIKPPVL